MIINLKNIHIFFAIESVWSGLDYRLKYHINQKVTANADDDFVQEINIGKDDLLNVFRAVSSQPEGVSAKINIEILNSLVPQIMALSNLAEVQASGGSIPPNEALQILIGIDVIDTANRSTKAAKILNGKTQILS